MFARYWPCSIGILLLVLLPGRAQEQDPFKHPFRNARDDPPKDWKGRIFRLRHDYPLKPPKAEPQPWKHFDPRKPAERLKYLEAIKDYCLEDNIEPAIDWQQVDKRQPRRIWYHAPWLHAESQLGREFVNGMTRERSSRPYELHELQTSWFHNWAVSLYNPVGGYTIGQVWKDPNSPNPKAARFRDGTVAVKLLFTTATEDQVPYLKNAKQWDGHVIRKTTAYVEGAPSEERLPGVKDKVPPPGLDEIRKVRLLQLDVAVRDDRFDCFTGWVFGTYVYNGYAPGVTAYHRLVPVGLMWGNDPDVTGQDGSQLRQSWRNPAAAPLLTHYGLGQRLNGPVDNPRSSCLSCHATAEIPQVADMVPKELTRETFKLWFRNLKAGDPFTKRGTVGLDYSLQLSAGMVNRGLAVGELKVQQIANSDELMIISRDGQRVAPVRRDGSTQINLDAFERLLRTPTPVKPKPE